jgi:hypothetical protein
MGPRARAHTHACALQASAARAPRGPNPPPSKPAPASAPPGRRPPTHPPTLPRPPRSQTQTPQGVIRAGLDIEKAPHSVTREAFPLPTLGPLLEAVREEVRAGRGFAVIRGFPVDR